MNDTLEVHAKFEGEPAEIIEQMIKNGRAANRTEAIRLALLDYNQHHPVIASRPPSPKAEIIDEEKAAWLSISETSLKKIWDNPKDDEVWSRY
jgi:Arc/MetJ-type ribon-helix-helix transcriptional regulator